MAASPLFQLATVGLEGYVYELVSKHLGVSYLAPPHRHVFRHHTHMSSPAPVHSQAFIHLSREQLNVSAWEGEIVFE